MDYRRRPQHAITPEQALADARRIDALYGLEPVFEPDAAGDAALGGVSPTSVDCPYCGEAFETLLDTSAGSAHYVEDCQVCCRPIEFDLDVDSDGTLVSLATLRSD